MIEVSPVIREQAPLILAEIQRARSILLHCHPVPDPDSVGSALAMRFAVEQLGKKVTVIRGDSELSRGFMHFPGAHDIVDKAFGDVDLGDYDLFISLDSGSRNMVSQKPPPTFPLSITTIVIDHHATNEMYGEINLVDIQAPAVSFILFQLFRLWNISLTPSIATNLFVGIYTDTGGFRYAPTDHRVIAAASELAQISPDFTETIFILENSNVKEAIYFQAVALNSVETFLGNSLAIASVSHKDLVEKKIPEEYVRGISIPNQLISVVGWNVGVSLVEIKPREVKASFRTRDKEKYDVSKIAAALGGGGHRAAAGAVLRTTLDEAKKLVVAQAQELYNL